MEQFVTSSQEILNLSQNSNSHYSEMNKSRNTYEKQNQQMFGIFIPNVEEAKEIHIYFRV